jgi:8-oxo-dGTP diphosphatase
MKLPKDLLRIPHEDLCQHVFLEYKQGDEWRVLDITWEQSLMSVLPFVDWDGVSSTALAVPADKWLSPEESERIMLLEGEALRKATEEDLQKNGIFYAALNAYLEGVREKRLDQVKVGFGVMVFKDGKLLLCKRGGGHAGGVYGFPGGHLEWMETLEEGAKREAREEAGIEIQNVRFLRFNNIRAYAPKHYADLTIVADWASGTPTVLEPDRWEGEWGWYDVDALPTPLFPTIPAVMQTWRDGAFDIGTWV